MNYKTADQLIAFEERVRALFADGQLPFLIHLCGGNERQLIQLFSEAQEGDWFFSTHRSAYHALLAGVPEARLMDLIRDGRSMFIFDVGRNFYSSSVLAGCCAIACGVAWELKRRGSPNKVWCFLGDGASEEGHFFESLLYATGWDLPVTFVLEDNDRSVDTCVADRRGPHYSRFLMSSEKMRRYSYAPTYPHGGAGLPPGSVTFRPEIVEKHTPSR